MKPVEGAMAAATENQIKLGRATLQLMKAYLLYLEAGRTVDEWHRFTALIVDLDKETLVTLTKDMP